jgi:hypothetical protein
MCFSGGGGGQRNLNAANDQVAQENLKLAQQQRQDEINRQNNISQGIDNVNNTFKRFDDNFYGQKRQNYADYYQPQVDYQHGQAQQQDLYQLARQGINNSSAGAQVYGDLAQQYGNQNQAIQSGANNYEQQIRGQVEAQRNSLINQATATANPTAAANSASNAVGSLQMVQPSGGYSPLAGIFNTFTGAGNTALTNYAYGNNGGILGQLFKPGSNSALVRSGSGGSSSLVIK